MVFIIKKTEIIDGLDTMNLRDQFVQAPCPVYPHPHENLKLQAYLLEHYGPGYYYVYLFGSNQKLGIKRKYTKYFRGVVRG